MSVTKCFSKQSQNIKIYSRKLLRHRAFVATALLVPIVIITPVGAEPLSEKST